MVRLGPVVILTAVLGVGPVGTLAATFNVTKTADTNDGTCDADCSLREAIVAANANAGLDAVAVPAGSYVLSLAGTGEDGSATGDLDVTDDLDLGGAGAGSTLIVGNGADRVLDIDPLSAGVTATISDVTITNGRAVPFGGGIRNAGTSTITGSTISDNRAESTQTNVHGVGGGVGTASGGVTTISNCLVTGNMATGDGDAGAAVGGGIGALEGETNVDASTITDNQAFATSLTFGGLGGGIGILGGEVSIASTSVSGNGATGFPAAGGGGIAVECDAFGPCGDVSITASTISDNDAFAFGIAGGGGALFSSGSFLLANSTVTDNGAETGLIPGSGTPAPGANLAMVGGSGTIANVTFEAGSGTGGIDLQSGGVATLRNTIVADSCSGSGIVANAYNLEHPGNTCGFSGTDLIGVDPLLGALADNGGPTDTMKLLAGSPAISGANPAAPGGGGAACESTDQRGVTRPVGARCDIGAYESECGDGDADAGEACDEGVANGTSASCCRASCVFKANGASCADDNVCTRPDTCQEGVCTAGPCASGACTLCGGTCSDAGGPCECTF
jgi:CSLREA domain-containing protein